MSNATLSLLVAGALVVPFAANGGEREMKGRSAQNHEVSQGEHESQQNQGVMHHESDQKSMTGQQTEQMNNGSRHQPSTMTSGENSDRPMEMHNSLENNDHSDHHDVTNNQDQGEGHSHGRAHVILEDEGHRADHPLHTQNPNDGHDHEMMHRYGMQPEEIDTQNNMNMNNHQRMHETSFGHHDHQTMHVTNSNANMHSVINGEDQHRGHNHMMHGEDDDHNSTDMSGIGGAGHMGTGQHQMEDCMNKGGTRMHGKKH